MQFVEPRSQDPGPQGVLELDGPQAQTTEAPGPAWLVVDPDGKCFRSLARDHTHQHTFPNLLPARQLPRSAVGIGPVVDRRRSLELPVHASAPGTFGDDSQSSGTWATRTSEFSLERDACRDRT